MLIHEKEKRTLILLRIIYGTMKVKRFKLDFNRLYVGYRPDETSRMVVKM